MCALSKRLVELYYRQWVSRHMIGLKEYQTYERPERFSEGFKYLGNVLEVSVGSFFDISKYRFS